MLRELNRGVCRAGQGHTDFISIPSSGETCPPPAKQAHCGKQKRHSISMSKVGVGLSTHRFRRIQYFEISERFQEVEFEHPKSRGEKGRIYG